MASHACYIQNNSGETIYVKLVGYRWDMMAMSKWPGPGNDGILYSAGPQQGFTANLFEGDRVVCVFSNSGSYMTSSVVSISAPTTITIESGGIITSGYSAPAGWAAPAPN